MRKKTRGGRDQDRWREIYHGVKIWRRARRKEWGDICDNDDCFSDSMSGTLTLSNNPDCDFVKGGE